MYAAAVAAHISFSRHLSAFLIEEAASHGINLAYSPLSINALLSFLSHCCTGPTKHQLLDFLKVHASHVIQPIGSSILLQEEYNPLGGPHLRYVSGVWLNAGANLKYHLTVIAEGLFNLRVHALPLRSLPEESRNQINNLVEQATDGLVKTLFYPQSITGGTQLVLGSAIYFKGKWDAPFRPWTTINDFHLHNGIPVKSHFMVTEQPQFISAFDGFKVLKLPYERGPDWREFSFYIFLPNTLNGFNDLGLKLRNQSDFLNNHIPERRVPVRNFRIPKFKISMVIPFAQYLKVLELDLPFKMTGDFSLMVNSLDASDYYVSEIGHARVLEVNEEGTEPTAVSWAATAAGCSMPIEAIEPIDFEADHPFIFFIREDITGVVFFAGHLLNPLVE